jgi:hypothetical protein
MNPQQTRIRDYKDLIVWQKSIDLVTQVYAVTAIFPNREQYGLISQMQRAAVSISSNIAEGQSRASAAEFRQFLSISLSESPKVLAADSPPPLCGGGESAGQNLWTGT